MSEFQEFPKMARWSRDIVITEKIDGTNAAVLIVDGLEDVRAPGAIAKVRNLDVFAQSRTRFITPEDDNYGFARWVVEHAEELCDRSTGLGEGRHFGEWWGSGCQRGYDLPKGEKRFSLFNTSRWDEGRPACCHVVPTLYTGPMSEEAITGALNALYLYGSRAAPGFMDPEGVVIFHTAANFGFKKTLKKDESPKSLATKGTAVSA
jgi:hypothetical protein